jgi:hypothetical protein
MDLWHAPEQAYESKRVLSCSVDGRRKPVPSNMLIPHGLIGRWETIPGCRASGFASR